MDKLLNATQNGAEGLNEEENEDSADDSDYDPQKDPEAAALSPSENSHGDDDDDDESTKKRKKMRKRRKGDYDDVDSCSEDESDVLASRSGRRRKAKKCDHQAVSDDVQEEDHAKQRREANWALFQERLAKTKKNSVEQEADQTADVTADAKSDCAPGPSTKIVQFAGEDLTIVNDEPADDPANAKKTPQDSLAAVTRYSFNEHYPPRRRSVGLATLVDIFSNTKAADLSTLDKSKLDWNTFKKSTGIEEELSIHNRGKDGYLAKQDFLERTDQRVFQQERAARLAVINNRK